MDRDLDRIKFTFVELRKFEQQRPQSLSQLTLEEKFYYYFLHAPTLSEAELAKLVGEDEVIRKAMDELNQFYWTKEELSAYERSERNRRDFQAMIAAAEDSGKAMMQEEIESQRQRAQEAECKASETEDQLRAERQKAEAQLAAERQKAAEALAEERQKNAKETAKKMKDEGVPIPTISRCTGLTEEEINQL